jgi:hypothetical protein
MKNNKFLVFVLVALIILLFSGCTAEQMGMAKVELSVDKGFAEGNEIYFIHTEVSSAELAKKMAAGMQSPVFYVPSLADVPLDAQANVYVFTNGVKGASMSGLQPSVFDNPPESAAYTPLRRLNMVTWNDATKARELKAASDVLEAVNAGELTIKDTGVVINMPFIIWDSGQR